MVKRLGFVAAAAVVATVAVLLTLAAVDGTSKSTDRKPCRGIAACTAWEKAQCTKVFRDNAGVPDGQPTPAYLQAEIDATGTPGSPSTMQQCMSNIGERQP